MDTQKLWFKICACALPRIRVKANNFQASISTDNHLRLYECRESGSTTPNSPTSLTWSLVEDFDVPSLPLTTPVSPSTTDTNAGGDVTPLASDPTGVAPTVIPSNPQVGGSTSPYMATATLNTSGAGLARPGSGNREADGGWDLSWCKEGYWGEVCAVTSGTNGIVKVYLFKSIV